MKTGTETIPDPRNPKNERETSPPAWRDYGMPPFLRESLRKRGLVDDPDELDALWATLHSDRVLGQALAGHGLRMGCYRGELYLRRDPELLGVAETTETGIADLEESRS